MSLLKKQIIRREDGSAYLIRWAFNTPFGGIKLHHILGSDEERDLHDHPWSFFSVILRGGYWEHVAVDPASDPRYDLRFTGMRPVTHRTWYGAGSALWRPAPSPHCLELAEGRTAWTLVFTGPKKREWGFRTICGWIPWTEYWRVKREGC